MQFKIIIRMQSKLIIRLVHTMLKNTRDKATSPANEKPIICHKFLEPWIDFARPSKSIAFLFSIGKAITSRHLNGGIWCVIQTFFCRLKML